MMKISKVINFFIIVIFSLLTYKNAFANTDNNEKFDSLDAYITAAKNAIDNSYFDKALNILNSAEKEFPDSYKPNFSKGKLYDDNDLSESAIEEFIKAKDKGLSTEELYIFLANCYGKTSQDKKAVTLYEEAFKKINKSLELYDNLGWMYYKINALDKGINIIREGLESYPDSSDLLMTLGTLYSEAYDYQKSKKFYLDSINKSFSDYKSNNFRCIALYNLAILEESFLYFDNSYNSAKAAISYTDRSSPHMQLSNLYFGALELKSAYDEAVKASSLEPKTFFPQVAVAKIYLLAGKIDQAINIINELLTNNDFSWMLYFGTNKDFYYAELYNLKSFSYKLKANFIDYEEDNIYLKIFINPFKKIYFTSMRLIYNIKFSNLSIKIGEEKLAGGSNLEGLHILYDAYENIWPQKSLKLLDLIEQTEIQSIPQKERQYNLKKAILKDRTSFFYTPANKIVDLQYNMAKLDKRWEKILLADVLADIAKTCNETERLDAIDQLVILQPSLLPLSNIKTKIQVLFYGEKYSTSDKKKFLKCLENHGIVNEPLSKNILQIDAVPDGLSINIFNEDYFIDNYFIKVDNYKDFRLLAKNIFDEIFIDDLDN